MIKQLLKIVFSYFILVPLIIYSQQNTNIPPDLQTQLSASASALEEAIANPNCPATQ